MAEEMGALRGVIAAMATPFTETGAVDGPVFAAHAATLLSKGCHLVGPFGTTGEAASLSRDARMAGLDALIAADLPAERLMPGTGAAALADALALTRHALERRVGAVLLGPPFFYAQPSDVELRSYFNPLLEVIAEAGGKAILYNIPKFTQVRITPDLIAALRARFGGAVAGVKDSSGDWEQTAAYLEIDAPFAVFPGSETLLVKSRALGGAGCISGSVNVRPDLARTVFDALDRGENADEAQAEATASRELLMRVDLIRAVKAHLSAASGAESWARFAPPLGPADPTAVAEMLSAHASRFGAA